MHVVWAYNWKVIVLPVSTLAESFHIVHTNVPAENIDIPRARALRCVLVLLNVPVEPLQVTDQN